MLSPLQLILVAIPIGLLAAWLMNLLMVAVSRQREVPVDMIEALGTLITGDEARAKRIGLIVHLLSGALFAVLYLALWVEFGLTNLRNTVYLGVGFGFLHGLLTSYCLMVIIAERHPLERYREATLPVGAIHLLGHIAYGLLVGFLGGVTLAAVG